MRALSVIILIVAMLPRSRGVRERLPEELLELASESAAATGAADKTVATTAVTNVHVASAHGSKRNFDATTWKRSVCEELGLLGPHPKKHAHGHCEGIEQRLLAKGWWAPGSGPAWLRRNQALIDKLIDGLAQTVECKGATGSHAPCEPMKKACQGISKVGLKLKGTAFLGKFETVFNHVILKANSWAYKHEGHGDRVPDTPHRGPGTSHGSPDISQEAKDKCQGIGEKTTDRIFCEIVTQINDLDKDPEEFSEDNFQGVVPYYVTNEFYLNTGFEKGSAHPRVGTHTSVDLSPLFSTLVSAVHPLPAFEGECYRTVAALPKSKDEVKVGGEPFQVYGFLPCYKDEPEERSTTSPQLVIKTKAGGWFRDISDNSKDGDKHEVLGMMGVKLRYISEPSEDDPFHRFEEV